MTLTKRDIARAVHEEEPGISIAEAVTLVDLIFGVLKHRLALGEKVMITNFGTFEIGARAPRRGINPATGERMIIAPHRTVTFRPSPAFQDRIDG